MGLRSGLLREGEPQYLTSRVVAPVSRRDRPFHNRAYPLADALRGYLLSIPDREKDAHYIGGRYPVHMPGAELWECVFAKGRPPLRLRFAASPSLFLDRDYHFNRRRKGRGERAALVPARIAAVSNGASVIGGLVPRFRQGRKRVSP